MFGFLKSKSQPKPERTILESLRLGRCPDCNGEQFLAGPSGGMSQNFQCANEECGSSFNIGFAFGNDLLFAERI